jgi:hypothetical protein
MLFAAAVSVFGAGYAQAGTIIGLVDGNSLAMIEAASRKVTSKVDIKGAGPLLGIDVRPLDGMLYGVSADGWVVTIDPKTGQATQKAKLSETLKPGVVATVDFNPVADRLRVMGSDGTNLRVNVEDGKAIVDGSHKYKEGDANADKTPKVVAGSYTNAMKGAQATALYDIDGANGVLATQAPPNDGALNTIGPLGVKVDGPAAFNIVAEGEGNMALLVAGGNLYAVDLKTGAASLAGKIEGLNGTLTDIAWWE